MLATATTISEEVEYIRAVQSYSCCDSELMKGNFPVIVNCSEHFLLEGFGESVVSSEPFLKLYMQSRIAWLAARSDIAEVHHRERLLSN